jgi:hypothetical protein
LCGGAIPGAGSEFVPAGYDYTVPPIQRLGSSVGLAWWTRVSSCVIKAASAHWFAWMISDAADFSGYQPT